MNIRPIPLHLPMPTVPPAPHPTLRIRPEAIRPSTAAPTAEGHVDSTIPPPVNHVTPRVIHPADLALLDHSVLCIRLRTR